MSSTSQNNKRIAKNTVMLYFRMIFLMLVTLYTSRVTLQVLGEEDFGIYNIVGTIVVMSSFLSASLTNACNRYLSVAVEMGDAEEIQKTFSTILVAHLLLVVGVLLLLETVGLWFVAEKLNIPEGRENIALIVYQIVVFTFCLGIVRIPFNSSVIANEKMGFFAYLSIVEGVLKLIIVWLLVVSPIEKLICYSLLILLTTVLINVWYIRYCTSRFAGNALVLMCDRERFRKMMTFSGWNMFIGVSDMGWQQGTNIILNIFYGVGLNATMGITNQVRNAVFSFVTNLQTAINPQIIKSYANNEKERFMTLVLAASKYSCFLMLLFAIPLLMNMEFILNLWLVVPPDHSVSFVSLILIFCVLDSIVGPLWISNQATGDVKVYSISVSFILLLNLPLMYLLFCNGFPPEYMLVVRIVIAMVSIVWQLVYSRYKIGLRLSVYMQTVVLPISIVTLIASSVTFVLTDRLEGWERLVLSTLCTMMLLAFSIYVFGLRKEEKRIVLTFLDRKFRHGNNDVV